MPSFVEVVGDMIESRLTGLHTMLPGKVVKVTLPKGKCDVQPLLMRLNSDGVPVPLPVITDCPIAFYRAGKAAVYLPVAVGDQVEIRFCERSLDTWLTKGGTVDPNDARKHNLSDAVAYPGLYDGTQPPIGVDPAALVVINDKAKILLKPDGSISMENASGSVKLTAAGTFNFTGTGGEFLKVVSDLMDILTKVTTPTLIGPQPFLPPFVAQITALKAKVDQLRG